jgi:hypothetical protein
MVDLLSRRLKLRDIDVGKEGQMSGALSGRMAQLQELLNENGELSQAPISVDPGDFIRIGDDGSPGLALTLPIAYDVWYLWQTINVLPEDAEERALFVDLVLNPLLERLGGLRPLRTILKEQLVPGDPPGDSFFFASGFSCIKEMRFETFLKDRAPEYPTPGPTRLTQPGQDLQNSGQGDIYSGYLAFPIGSLGVMEQISFICDSLLDSIESEGQEYDGSYDAMPGNTLLPPFESQPTQCKGLKLFEKAYLQACPDVEYPAPAFQGTDSILPHHWLRLWLPQENKYPIPGEFVGISVKPQAVPPHCWWFQETSPFLYSGNWFETDYYTSGIVLAVIKNKADDEYEVASVSPSHPQRTGYGDFSLAEGQAFTFEDEIGSIYKVRVKDQDIYLKSTDFKEYFVDERVAIVKRAGIINENFKWNQLEPGKQIPGHTVESLQEYDNGMSGQLFAINTEWVIAPITFYEE